MLFCFQPLFPVVYFHRLIFFRLIFLYSSAVFFFCTYFRISGACSDKILRFWCLKSGKIICSSLYSVPSTLPLPTPTLTTTAAAASTPSARTATGTATATAGQSLNKQKHPTSNPNSNSECGIQQSTIPIPVSNNSNVSNNLNGENRVNKVEGKDKIHPPTSTSASAPHTTKNNKTSAPETKEVVKEVEEGRAAEALVSLTLSDGEDILIGK